MAAAPTLYSCSLQCVKIMLPPTESLKPANLLPTAVPVLLFAKAPRRHEQLSYLGIPEL